LKPKLLAAIAGLLIREEYFFSCRLKKETPAVAVKKVRKLRREILGDSETGGEKRGKKIPSLPRTLDQSLFLALVAAEH